MLWFTGVLIILFLCMNVFACTYVNSLVQETEEAIGFLGTGVTDNCGLLGGCWEPDLGPLEEQLVFLTAEPLWSLLKKV